MVPSIVAWSHLAFSWKDISELYPLKYIWYISYVLDVWYICKGNHCIYDDRLGRVYVLYVFWIKLCFKRLRNFRLIIPWLRIFHYGTKSRLSLVASYKRLTKQKYDQGKVNFCQTIERSEAGQTDEWYDRSQFIGWVEFMALITYSRGIFRMQESWWWKLQLCSTKAWTGMCTTQAARNVRYQGPLLPYYSKGNSPAVWLLGRHGSCRQAVYVNVHTYMHRYGCCTCMYMVVISLIFLFFNFWRSVRKESFGYFPNPDRCGVILGKPWVFHGPSTFWMATRRFPSSGYLTLPARLVCCAIQLFSFGTWESCVDYLSVERPEC